MKAAIEALEALAPAVIEEATAEKIAAWLEAWDEASEDHLAIDVVVDRLRSGEWRK